MREVAEVSSSSSEDERSGGRGSVPLGGFLELSLHAEPVGSEDSPVTLPSEANTDPGSGATSFPRRVRELSIDLPPLTLDPLELLGSTKRASVKDAVDVQMECFPEMGMVTIEVRSSRSEGVAVDMCRDQIFFTSVEHGSYEKAHQAALAKLAQMRGLFSHRRSESRLVIDPEIERRRVEMRRAFSCVRLAREEQEGRDYTPRSIESDDSASPRLRRKMSRLKISHHDLLLRKMSRRENLEFFHGKIPAHSPLRRVRSCPALVMLFPFARAARPLNRFASFDSASPSAMWRRRVKRAHTESTIVVHQAFTNSE